MEKEEKREEVAEAQRHRGTEAQRTQKTDGGKIHKKAFILLSWYVIRRPQRFATDFWTRGLAARITQTRAQKKAETKDPAYGIASVYRVRISV